MKKSALAVAVLGAFAGAAYAQSSVTMFGIVDLNFRYVNNDETAYSLSQDGESSSRLGFRGVEDLGGGLKASFWLEAAIGPDTGRGGASYGNGTTSTSIPCGAAPGCPASGAVTISNENAFMFQRRATLSLSHDKWGEVRLGRDYTPQFWNWAVFDPLGFNGVGSSGNLMLAAANVGQTGATYGTLVRANNSVQYILPNGVFGPGLYGNAMVSAGESDVGNKMWGLRVGYAAGPFNVAASYSDTDLDVATLFNMTQWNIAGSWDFGQFGKISGLYAQFRADGPWATGPMGDRGQDNWFIGYVVPIGKFGVRASYGQVSGSGNVAPSSRDATQFAIGGTYDMSKRTRFYATASWIQNDPASNFRVANTGSGLTAGENSNGFEIGVRHSF